MTSYLGLWVFFMGLTDEQQVELFKMVSEIYHHLGLDGQRPLSFNHIQETAQKDILKWRERKRIKNNVSEKH